MRITFTITNPDGPKDDPDLLSLDVFPDMTLATLKNSIHAETRIEPMSQHVYHNGQLMHDEAKTLQQLQIVDGEMLALHVRDMRGTTGLPEQPARNRARQDPEIIRLQLQDDPQLRQQLLQSQPQLVAALDDPRRFAQVMDELYDGERRGRLARQRQIAALNADPFDVEAQARIEEMIRQERIVENLQSAMEHNPAVFAYVNMLYLDVEVNGQKTKALVDSGAQCTIMSPACAEACGIMRLVDKRYAGIARGVGTAKILGRVHSAQIKIGSLFLMCSFTVMEGKNVDLLLGLDMLKRHQAVIDLAHGKMVIQGVDIPFLGEADMPGARDAMYQEEPQIAGPVDATSSQRTGAVSAPEEAVQPTQPTSQAPQPLTPAPPSSAPVSLPAAGPATLAPAPPTFPRDHIDRLVQLGADEARAIYLLEATGGNLELAAGMIFDN